MAGCFGNSIFDRSMEQQLFNYLDSLDEDYYECKNCDFEAHSDDWDYDDDRNVLICPDCKTEIKL